jgi:hypothetical protein
MQYAAIQYLTKNCNVMHINPSVDRNQLFFLKTPVFCAYKQ